MRNQKIQIQIIIFALLFPMIGSAQKANHHWTTPIQNVEFTDSLILKTNSSDAQQVFDNLKPVNFDITLVQIYYVQRFDALDWDTLQNYEKELIKFVEEWEINKVDKQDKQKFLESCVLVILLTAPSNNHVPENIPPILKQLERDGVKSVAHNSRLVEALYNSYFKMD